MLYEELIINVYGITKTDPRLGSLIKDVGGWYNNYRHRLHVSVINLANEFNALYKEFVLEIHHKNVV